MRGRARRALLASAPLAALLLTATPARAVAQDWGVSWFPYVLPSSNEFPLIVLGFDYSQIAPFDAPYTMNGALKGTVGATLTGGWLVRALVTAPGLVDGWRFHAVASTAREKRFGFYGIGNGTVSDDALTDVSSEFYRVQRTQHLVQGEVTRRVKGPLRAALAARVQRTEFAPLQQTTLFGSTVGETIGETDASARLTAVLDTRDQEFNPRETGIFAEAGVKVGTGGDGYTWTFANAAAFVSPREGTIIGVRLAGANASGDPPLSQRFEFNTWEQDRVVYGGRFSNRGYADGRYAGRGVVMGNVEVRHDLLNVGVFGGITLFGFADAGRVFETEHFTLDDLHMGAGGGVMLRVLKSNIWTVTFAGGEDGFHALVTWGWTF